MQTSTFTKTYYQFCLFYLVYLLLCSQAVRAQDQSNYQQSIKKISDEINYLSRNINANKSKFEKEQTKLLKAEQELKVITEKLSAARAEIKQSLVLINELEQKQQQLQLDQEKSKEALRKLIVSNHKNGTPSQLKLFLNQENPYAVGRLNNYQTYFSTAVTQRFAQLESELEASRTLQDIQTLKIAELQNLEQEQEFLKKTKTKKNEERRVVLNRLNKKVEAAENKLKKLTVDRQRLNTLLEKLEKQKAEFDRIEKARLEAERKAAEKAKREGKKPSKKVIRTPVKGGFLKQQGRLNCPVDVEIKTKFGERILSSGMRSEGVFYNTKESVPVKSIFRGRVLFADFLKGFGLLLIVDHGDDHISLYGHNEILYKQVGDSVNTNETISKTGTTGGLRTHGLYFEIRNKTTPINPAKWCE